MPLPWSSFSSYFISPRLHVRKYSCLLLPVPPFIKDRVPDGIWCLFVLVGPVYRKSRCGEYFWQAEFPVLQSVCSACPVSGTAQLNLTIGPFHFRCETEYDAAQNLMAFCPLGFIDWCALASVDPGNVTCGYYDLESVVVATLLLS